MTSTRKPFQWMNSLSAFCRSQYGPNSFRFPEHHLKIANHVFSCLRLSSKKKQSPRNHSNSLLSLICLWKVFKEHVRKITFFSSKMLKRWMINEVEEASAILFRCCCDVLHWSRLKMKKFGTVLMSCWEGRLKRDEFEPEILEKFSLKIFSLSWLT